MKYLLLTLFIVCAVLPVLPAEDQVLTVEQPETPSVWTSPLTRLNQTQAQLKDSIAVSIKKSKSGETPLPLLLLIALAAAYGTVHALGPGHGKFVSASYAVSQKITVLRGALYGLGVGLFHGICGIVLILALSLLLSGGLMTTSDQAYHHAETASRILIVGLGLYLVSRGIYLLRSAKPEAADACAKAAGKAWLQSLPPILALGLIPCPGVIMIMLFCLSLGMLKLGVLLAAVFSLGMALTLASINVIAVLGKRITVGTLAKRRLELAENIICILCGLAVAAFGIMLLR